jgi:hypothetical protein
VNGAPSGDTESGVWYACSKKGPYHPSAKASPGAQELEDAFAAWLETCRPDERLESAAGELLSSVAYPTTE